jgi:hypothetical protein
MLAYDDDFCDGKYAFYLACRIQTVPVRHADILDHDVGTFLPGFLHGVTSIHDLRANWKRGIRGKNERRFGMQRRAALASAKLIFRYRGLELQRCDFCK